MAKKATKGSSKPKGMSSADHRKVAEQHYAKARLHTAHADLKDAKNPPKKSMSRGYPC
jgi:hypothetical protein